MSRSARGRALLGAALAAIVVLGLLTEALLDRSERVASTNTRVPLSTNATTVDAGDRYCTEEPLVRDAARLRLFAGTFGRLGPPLEVTIRSGGTVIATGRSPGGYRDDSPVTIDLGAHAAARIAEVCVRNAGTNPVRFANAQSPTRLVPGEEIAVRMDFLLQGRLTNAQMAPRLAQRASRMKSSLVGPWTIWLLAGLVPLLGVLAVRTALRDLER